MFRVISSQLQKRYADKNWILCKGVGKFHVVISRNKRINFMTFQSEIFPIFPGTFIFGNEAYSYFFLPRIFFLTLKLKWYNVDDKTWQIDKRNTLWCYKVISGFKSIFYKTYFVRHILWDIFCKTYLLKHILQSS